MRNVATAIDGRGAWSLQQFISAHPAGRRRRAGRVAPSGGDPDAVLTVDEAGLPKKGAESARAER